MAPGHQDENHPNQLFATSHPSPQVKVNASELAASNMLASERLLWKLKAPASRSLKTSLSLFSFDLSILLVLSSLFAHLPPFIFLLFFNHALTASSINQYYASISST